MPLESHISQEAATATPLSQASHSGAQVLVEALAASEVYLSFGIPGTHNIELYDALQEHPDMQPVLITDEQSAGFMADGVYRASGQIAALNLVPGAGLTHALSGIAEAFMDQIPLLVLMCAPRQDTGHSYQLHDIDQAAMIAPVVKKVFKPQNHAELYGMSCQAARLAQTAPCAPVAVEVPAELFFTSSQLQSIPAKILPSWSTAQSCPDLNTAVTQLNQCQNLGIYLGYGCRAAAELIMPLAERLDALVFTSVSAKGLVDESHERFVWNTMGRALPKPLQSFDKNLDGLLAIGCRFGEVATASYGFRPPETLIHVDIDSEVFHQNYPASQAIQADARAFLTALQAQPQLKTAARSTQKLEKLKQAQRSLAKQPTSSETIQPQALFHRLQHVFGPDTIYATDSGNGLFLAMEHLKLKKPQSFLAPVDFSCMGYSIPAAIGAKLAQPQRPVVACTGDGAALMTGLEMLSARHHNLGIVFVILNDGKLSQIAQFQKNAMAREPQTTLPSIDFKALAQTVGLSYIHIQRPEGLHDGLCKAKELTKLHQPVLVDVHIDYSQPSAFTKGVLKTNFQRLAWKDRLRMASRLIQRKLTH